MSRPVLVWFRNNLRIDDNEVLRAGLAESHYLVPVYCFDPRHFQHTPLGFPKTGSHRARFLLESVRDLRKSLRSHGSDLILRFGEPEHVIPELAARINASAIYTKKEVTAEEELVDDHVRAEAKKRGIPLHSVWDDTLYHVDDLPFAVSELPEVFTHFRKECEGASMIRDPHDALMHWMTIEGIDPGKIPALLEFGLPEPAAEPRAAFRFHGGESTAWSRMEDYFWHRDRLRDYKQTRNGMLGEDYSTKLSPWLAHGCISPRRIHAEVKRYEADRVTNDSTYWLVFELMWRDYFRFIAWKHGTNIFKRGGIKRVANRGWSEDLAKFGAWREGRTGQPLIDANMMELALTGFQSNRGRQNAASYLAHDLGVDWTWGAQWFESQLIDYDVASNWCNWNYVAGVGNDPREGRRFDPARQSEKYDPEGAYVKHWLG
ncbi:MAG: DASH family cryptochrome [Gemmatimonadetes bacterium]|nr:DASH family cryptochrome [Gemmatimonadota bacterium]